MSPKEITDTTTKLDDRTRFDGERPLTIIDGLDRVVLLDSARLLNQTEPHTGFIYHVTTTSLFRNVEVVHEQPEAIIRKPILFCPVGIGIHTICTRVVTIQEPSHLLFHPTTK